MTDDLLSQAAALRALHRPGDPLLLPNAWDAGSAVLVTAAGFPAVATSSSAVAESMGYGDGELTPPAAMLAAVARICRAVTVPVTADLERGYGLRPAELVERLLDAGAVGLNLEDSDPRTGRLVDVEEQVDLLAEVRAAAEKAEIPVVLNARIDVFLRSDGDSAAPLAEAVHRANRYLTAGADCVYPIMLADPAALSALVAAVPGAVNVLARPGAPAVPELAALGVARVSFGGGLYDSASTHTRRQLDAVRAGTDPFVADRPAASG